MSPVQIKQQIQKLAAGMKEADDQKHDHMLHATLEKLYQKHGAKKMLAHMAHMMHGLDKRDPAHNAGKPGDIAEGIEGLLPDDGTVEALAFGKGQEKKQKSSGLFKEYEQAKRSGKVPRFMGK